MNYIDNIDVLSMGSAPLIASMCRELNIAETVNDLLVWDKDQWKVTPGDTMVTLIVNLLVSRSPLYRIKEFYQNTDLDLLFGPGKVKLESLHDSRYGRLLDRLFDANPKNVYKAISINAIVQHGIDVRTLHADTTSKSVTGAYDKEGELNITYGNSKDKRPDLM